MKGVVPEWQREQFSNSTRRIKECKEGLKKLSTDPIPHDPVELVSSLERKKNMMIEHELLRLLEEQWWRQKSRAIWLKDGDWNTFFFPIRLLQVEDK